MQVWRDETGVRAGEERKEDTAEGKDGTQLREVREETREGYEGEPRREVGVRSDVQGIGGSALERLVRSGSDVQGIERPTLESLARSWSEA